MGSTSPLGLLLTSLSLVNFSYVTQFLVNEHALRHQGNTTHPQAPPRADFLGPLLIQDLHVYAPRGHVAISKDDRGMLVTYGSSPLLDTTPSLLTQYLNQGPRFLAPLANERGWAVVGLDFQTNKVLVATDAFATKPIYLASRTGGQCSSNDDGGCGAGIAISSHRSALERLGFTGGQQQGEIREVNRGMVMVLDRSTLTERFSLDLASLVPPSRPQNTAWNTRTDTPALPAPQPTAHFDVDFHLAVKRSLGMALRRPQSNPSSDGPRLFLVRHGDGTCLSGEDLMLSSLVKLPIPFVVYHIDSRGETIHKVSYVGGQPLPQQPRSPQRLPLLGEEILQHLEPSLSGMVAGPLLVAFTTVCQDAHDHGVPLYLSETHVFQYSDDPMPSPPPAALRLEEFITQGFGIVCLWPLLASDVIQAFRSLHINSKSAIRESACSALKPSPGKAGPPQPRQKSLHDHVPPTSPETGPTPPTTTAVEDSPDILADVTSAIKARGMDDAMAYLHDLLTTGGGHDDGQDLPPPVRANLSAELGLAYQIQGRIPDAIGWYHRAVEADRALHSAYVLMAQLGLGPESAIARSPPDMKEEIEEALRAAIVASSEEGENPNPRFREVCQYDLGATLYYSSTGREAEAQQVYREIIKVASSEGGDGTRTNSQVAGVSGGREGESLVVITVASENTPELANLVASAEVSGVELRVLGQGVAYTGHEVKLQLYWDFMASNTTSDDQLILAIDAYDVIVTPAISRLPETYRSFDRPIIFAAERACWPDAGVSLLYEAAGRVRGHALPYLNSGSFVGRKRDLALMLNVVTQYKARFSSDQRLFTRFYLEHPEMVVLDHSSQMFYMLHYTTTPLIFHLSGRVQLAGVGEPAVLHANAGDGKAFYTHITTAWRAARATNSSTLAANIPYFRGVSHFGHEEPVLALVSFLSHLANHTDYLPEVAYNIGYILDHLDEPDLARLYYLHSLQLGLVDDVGHQAAANLARLELRGGTLGAAHHLVLEALERDPSNRALDVLSRAFNDTGLHRLQGQSLSTPALVLHEAYQPTTTTSSGSPTINIHDILAGSKVDAALTRLLDEANGMTQAFQKSSYFAAGLLLCSPSLEQQGVGGGRRQVSFPYARVLRLFHYMDQGLVKHFCDEFSRGVIEGEAAAGHQEELGRRGGVEVDGEDMLANDWMATAASVPSKLTSALKAIMTR